MNQTRKELLEEEYQRTMKEVSLAQTETEEAKWAIQKLTELHKQIMEETNVDNKNFMEKRDKVLSIIKIAVDGVGIVLPIWASWTWMARGLQFEKTGTFTSRTGSWMSNHLRLFKK